MSKVITFPFEEKNEKDFIEITEQINKALEKIEKDISIPATEMQLAKLSKVSRGTLRNRIWPIDRLKQIKLERKKVNKPKKITSGHRIETDKYIEKEKALINRIKNYQYENSCLFDEVVDLKNEVIRLNESIKTLTEKNEDCELKLKEIKNKIQVIKSGNFMGINDN